MAIMIPSVISPEVKSPAERKIFEWFQSVPGTDDWIVLHSMGITTHNKVIYGEIDFLVLAPRLGIFALEVKGGRVKRENGIWCFTNRYGKTNHKSRGPFEQAKDGIFSVVAAMKKRLDGAHRYLSGVLFGYGVMFPDIEYTASGIEEEQWQVFDSRHGANVAKFVEQLSEGAVFKWEALYGEMSNSKMPDTADVKYMASVLRGDFDCAISLGTQLRNAKDALISLTKEQYCCLDQLDDNPRCLIQGPAGTGKTLLAIEEVKKSVARGEKVALFCFNTNLADWMAGYFEEMAEPLRPEFVGTFHKYMTRIVKVANITLVYPNDPDKVRWYYQEELPEAAQKVLEDASNRFDKIIIDEGQDLIRDNYLNVMDCCLRKGLDRGRWTMFGDFSMQAIYADGMSGAELIEKLDDIATFIRFKLTVNCRNTRPICKEIQTVTGFIAPNGLWTKVDGPPVQYITWSTMEEQRERLEGLLKQLEESNIAPESITILSPRKREDSVVSMLQTYDVPDFRIPQKMNTTFCTVQGYKGLENTVIILTDIEDFSSEKLMYVGLSRACSGLFILESEVAKKEYDELLIGRLLP